MHDHHNDKKEAAHATEARCSQRGTRGIPSTARRPSRKRAQLESSLKTGMLNMHAQRRHNRCATSRVNFHILKSVAAHVRVLEGVRLITTNGPPVLTVHADALQCDASTSTWQTHNWRLRMDHSRMPRRLPPSVKPVLGVSCSQRHMTPSDVQARVSDVHHHL